MRSRGHARSVPVLCLEGALALAAAAGLAAAGPQGAPQRPPLSVSRDQVPPYEPEDLPAAPTSALAPGVDMCLGLAWEPTIAVDPNDPAVVAVAQGTTVQVSFDAGASFSQTLNAAVPGNYCAGGDPSLGFDSQGRLYLTYLGSVLDAVGNCPSPPAFGRDVFISRWSRAGNAFVLSLGPVNVTLAANHGPPQNADKEWLAVDWWPGSPFRDNLYVVWTDLDQTPWQVWTTRSADGGSTWSNALQLSIPAEGDKPWPAHDTVAPNGDVYVAYHSQLSFLDPGTDRVPNGISGQIVAHRSTNGGLAYTKTATNPYDPSECDMTWNVQHASNGVIPRASYWLQGSVQPWILADPHVVGRIYVVANDDPDDDVDVGDPADVYLVRSDDFGASWTAPIRVDDGPDGTFAVMPTAAVDPVGGAICVTWYDNRPLQIGASGDWLLDLRASYSADDGSSWLPSIDVNDGLFDPGQSASCRFCCNPGDCSAGSPMTLRIGEYNGVAYGECAAHITWADNQQCNGGGSMLDVFYDRDPELGGDLTPPAIMCPPNVDLGCNDPTDPQFTGVATATDDCDLDPAVAFVDVILPGSCPPGTVLFTIQRIWSASDDAGNLATCDQLITVTDFDPPQIFGNDLNIVGNTTGCVLANDPVIQNWAAAITAADDCGQASVSFNLPASFPADCPPGRRTNVIVSAEDPCGNSDFLVLHVTVTLAPGAGVPFCFGDGSGNPCPCGNSGLGGHGCEIAQATGGICLTAQDFLPDGNGGGSVTLLGTNLPLGTTPAVVAIRSAPGQLNAGGAPFGDGKLCLLTPVVRVGSGFAQDGKARIPLNHGAGPGRFNYQLWLRNNPAAFCTPDGFNTSNGLILDW